MEWILLNSRFPKIGKPIILSITDSAGNSKVEKGYVDAANKLYTFDKKEVTPFVTAWMPFPTPYQIKEDNKSYGFN
jgi:hypothetical protein